jgi:C4-dicarboxylate-specific signal transduction histidine kinase
LRLRQITVATSLAESDPVVMGSEIQLEQVFINLLTNARDALAEAPHKLISITSQVEGERVVLAVRDTGEGVPAEFEQRIFDPFFTTKEVGKGTGLGLSITYGIIQEHGGAITLENHPGHGATFRIELPLSDPASTPRELFT